MFRLYLKKRQCRSSKLYFRPISFTSVVQKLLKAIIRDGIFENLEKQNLIQDTQHGSRKPHSCLTNLIIFF